MTFQEMVKEELASATKKYGPIQSFHEAYGVIMEEVCGFWEEVKLWPCSHVPKKMLKELVQTAAMCERTARDLGLLKDEEVTITFGDILRHEPSEKAVMEETLITNKLALFLDACYVRSRSEATELDPHKAAQTIRWYMRHDDIRETVIVELIRALVIGPKEEGQ